MLAAIRLEKTSNGASSTRARRRPRRARNPMTTIAGRMSERSSTWTGLATRPASRSSGGTLCLQPPVLGLGCVRPRRQQPDRAGCRGHNGEQGAHGHHRGREQWHGGTGADAGRGGGHRGHRESPSRTRTASIWPAIWRSHMGAWLVADGLDRRRDIAPGPGGLRGVVYSWRRASITFRRAAWREGPRAASRPKTRPTMTVTSSPSQGKA